MSEPSFLTTKWPDDNRGKPLLEERRKFIDWMSMPAADREPPKLRDFAESIGISYSTAKAWRHDSRLIAAVSDRVGRHIDVDMVPDITASLYRQSINERNPRSVTAARTLLEYLRWNVERNEKIGAAGISELSDEELRDQMMAALDELDERHRRETTSHHAQA